MVNRVLPYTIKGVLWYQGESDDHKPYSYAKLFSKLIDNWRTDWKEADKTLNKGACFVDVSGNVIKEIPHLTGAYIDMKRGALKAPDVSPEKYPSGLSIFPQGVYHIYDYQFFYRNLQENVAARIEAYFSGENEEDDAA